MIKIFICQYCKQPFQKESWKGYIPKYCSRRCMGSAKTQDSTTYKTCPSCHKDFITKKPNQTYCSINCRPQNNHDKSKHEIKICVVCGKKFDAWIYRKSKCCSKKCASKLSNGISKPTKRRPDSFVERVCKLCGNKFKIHKIYLTRKNYNQGQYCSKDCAYKTRSINMRGKLNHNYKEGASSYRGLNWHSQAHKARKRDNYTCQVCSKSGKFDHERIDVHHIIPFRCFNGDWEKANQLSNLISVCRRCHRLLESNKIPLPQSR